MTERVDVLVVGSGAGGGTVAARLAELAAAGQRVLVLEEGPRFDPGDFSGSELESAERLYRDGGAMMVDNGTVALAMGVGYGGSTVMYTGTSVEPPASVIDGWQIPGVDSADLIRRARMYAAQNGVHFVPEDELNDNNRLFAEGCRRLGWTPRQFPVNTRGCRGASLCNLGCPNNAKQGTHVVQLPKAEASGVEVVTGARVLQVEPGSAWVAFQPGVKPPWSPGRHRVRAETLVLCAGAVETPALMLRSGLGRSLPALGRYFTCHPAHILVAEHDRPISNDVGHPKSFLWDERIEQDRFFLEVCMYFPLVTAKNLTGFGPEHEAFMRAYPRLQMILLLACDRALPGQRVRVDRLGRTRVQYRLSSETIDALVRGTRAASRIFFAAGARAVHAPSARPIRIEREAADQLDRRISARHFKPGSISVSAAHLMGGCRLGVEARHSVTRADGQVHGMPGLYVADASLFPSALEANPYLTIMALADQVSDAVVERAMRVS